MISSLMYVTQISIFLKWLLKVNSTVDLDFISLNPTISALEYEKDGKNLQTFFDTSLPDIHHPEVQGWGKDLLAERERLHPKHL